MAEATHPAQTPAQILHQTIARLTQAPPPYTPPMPNPLAAHFDGVDDDSGDEDDEEPRGHQVSLTINGATSIHGSGNVVAMHPFDGAKAAAVIVSSLKDMMKSEGGRPTTLKVQINCGISIVGDRNVLRHGGLPLRAVAAQNGAPGVLQRPGSAAVPAKFPPQKLKRKMDDEGEEGREESKVVKIESTAPSSSS